MLSSTKHTPSSFLKFLFLSCLVFFFGSISLHLTSPNSSKNQPSLSAPDTKDQNLIPSPPREVLGERTPNIYISSDKDRFSGGKGGLIALASTDDPAVDVDAYGISQPAEISLYQGSKDALLDYLIYNKEGKQVKSQPDIWVTPT